MVFSIFDLIKIK